METDQLLAFERIIKDGGFSRAVRDLLARGVGVAFLTRALVREELAAGRLAEIEVSDLPASFRESRLVCLNRGAPLPVAITDFVTMLREEVSEFCCDGVYP